MSKFKAGEYVLVGDGSGRYVVRRIYRIQSDGSYLVDFGLYSTAYLEHNLHKCPKSLIPKGNHNG